MTIRSTTLMNMIACAIMSLALQACGSSTYMPPRGEEVAQAFETTGVVSMQPYTRSIFNTGNF